MNTRAFRFRLQRVHWLLILTTVIALSLAPSGRECNAQDANSSVLSNEALEQRLAGLIEQKQSHQTFSANFTEKRFSGVSREPISTAGKIQFKAPNLMRREVQGVHPSLMVSDGKSFWIYYPNLKQAEHYPAGKNNPASRVFAVLQTALDFGALTNNFVLEGTERAGTLALRMKPKKASMKRWIDIIVLHFGPANEFLGMEIATTRGERIQSHYTNISHSPIPDSNFQFQPPAGTEVTGADL